MTVFEIHECTSKICGLRLPLDPDIHSGDFCPRCGAPMACVVPAYQNMQSKPCQKSLARSVEVVLDNVRSAYNVGSIFRTADGVGVRRVYLCGITPNPDEDPSVRKTALGADGEIEWTKHLNGLDLIRELHQHLYHIIALERTPNALDIYQFQPRWVDERPVVLVVGNERAGIDPGLLDYCQAVLSLPMMGKKSSLNVAVAFGAAAYQICFLG